MTYDYETALTALPILLTLMAWIAVMVFPEWTSAACAAFFSTSYAEAGADELEREPGREMTKEEYRAWVRHEFDTTAKMNGMKAAMSFLGSIPDMDDWPPQSEIDAALEAEGIEREVERRKDSAKPYRGRRKSKYRLEGDGPDDIVDISAYTPPEANTNPNLEINH